MPDMARESCGEPQTRAHGHSGAVSGEQVGTVGKDVRGGGAVAAAVILGAVHGERWVAGADTCLYVSADAQQPRCGQIDQLGWG
jgi:hypothetical protein